MLLVSSTVNRHVPGLFQDHALLCWVSADVKPQFAGSLPNVEADTVGSLPIDNRNSLDFFEHIDGYLPA